MRNKVAAVGLVLSVLLWIAAGAGYASLAELARARALVDQASRGRMKFWRRSGATAGDVNYDYLLVGGARQRPARQGHTRARAGVAVNPDFAGARPDFARA